MTHIGILTAREQEILRLISYGNTNRSMADRLGISESTVATHRKNIQRKLNAGNTALLVRVAFENGLIR